MFLRIFFLLFVAGWYSANCYVPVPPIYRKAELALKRYISHPSHNPIIYSLLNVLIHDKQAKAFISDQAIEMALENVKKIDKKSRTNNEQPLRQVIYGKNCQPNDSNCSPANQRKINQPTSDLKQHIMSELDNFFGHTHANDHWPISVYQADKA